MHKTARKMSRRALAGRGALLGSSLLAGLISQAYAQTAPATPATQTIEVTGFRKSLESSANAKKEATGFTDSIFSEDMGKFPDANIAESVLRIPGLTIVREITGEGLQIQIRGLGTNFTRTLLNGAPFASASTGRTDAQSANREVDLDFLPTELITSIRVAKSPTASMLEGGAAGIVDMRSARPFDKKGNWGSFGFQLSKNDPADKWGNRGSALGAMKFGESLGVLAGFAWSNNQVKTTGFETIGWTNLNITNGICGTSGAANGSAAACNTTGGGNWSLPGVSAATGFGSVPANAGNGLTTGQVIDSNFLLTRNPGLTIQQLSNALIPRLGRQMVQEGSRDRLNGILSVEFKPTSDLDFYLDTIVGKKENKLERSDMNWVGRNGTMIPLNMEVDKTDCSGGCVVTKGTFANAQFFLEYRPHNETTDFWSFNPGFEWRLNDKLKIDGQVNATRSTFHRESPTVLLITPGSSGVTVDYTNDGSTPVINSNVNLNDPASFGWPGGRVNVQEERREIETKGARANVTWGDKAFSVMGGVAFDDISRRITSIQNDAAWQNAICGNNLSVFLPGPNTTNPGGCNGAVNTAQSVAQYTGYGTGFTAGATTPLAFLGSLIPNANVRNYLVSDPRGFVSLDFAKLAQDSNYALYSGANGPAATNSTNTGTNPGFIQEKVKSIYFELNGRTALMGNLVRYNAGIRHARTEQTFGTLRSVADPRNGTNNANFGDGGRFPNILEETKTTTNYSNTLPSMSVAFNIRPDLVWRGSYSKSMTRANPTDLRATTLQFSDPAAIQGTLTNSDLKPYVSTNMDVGLEWYTGQEGYLAGTFFSKDIKAFTAAKNVTMPFSALAQYGVTYANLAQQAQRDAIDLRGGPNVADVIITQQVNSPDLLNVEGIELTWVQPLTMLPIKGFGFSANYTRISQSGGPSGFIATGVAPHTYNLTGYYEANGLMLRLSYNFSKGSQSTNSPQNGITGANLFSDDYEQLDFSSRYDIGSLFGMKRENVQASFDIQNLTKSIQRSYFQFPNAAFTEYKPGRTYFVGVRTKF